MVAVSAWLNFQTDLILNRVINTCEVKGVFILYTRFPRLLLTLLCVLFSCRDTHRPFCSDRHEWWFRNVQMPTSIRHCNLKTQEDTIGNKFCYLSFQKLVMFLFLYPWAPLLQIIMQSSRSPLETEHEQYTIKNNNTQLPCFWDATARLTSRLYFANIGFTRTHDRLITCVIMEYAHDIAAHSFVI